MNVEIRTFTDTLDCIEDKTNFSRSNYFRFYGTTTFLAIKISRTAKPFFGISKDVIDFANGVDDKFYLVLLTSHKSGWVYSKNEVNSNIKNGFWRLRIEDNNYKINHGDLSDANHFVSHGMFLTKIVLRGGKGDIVSR